MKKKIIPLLLASSMIMSGTALAYNDINGHWAEYDIKVFTDSKIIQGYEDGTIRPDNLITREEAIQIMSNFKGPSGTEIDVPNDAKDRWSTEAIQNLLSLGIISGYEDGSIRPEQNITRAEFTTMAYNYLHNEKRLLSSFYTFNDIENSWASHYIKVLSGNNVISGYPDGTFRPDSPITRAEAIRIMSNFNNIAEFGITDEQIRTIFFATNHIKYGQDHLSNAEAMKWDHDFLDALTQKDLIDVYKKYLSLGGSPYDDIEFGWYLTDNAPIKPDWKERFEKNLFETYGKTVSHYVHGEGPYYSVVVHGDNNPHGYFVIVNSITGYYRG